MVSHVPIWTVDSPKRASLAFTRHPCSLQPGLSSDGLRPSATIPLLPKHVHFLRYVVPCLKRLRGESPHSQVYQGVSLAGKTASSARRSTNLVPKGRFELPRGYPHYALNVARLPFRHFGRKCCEARSRTPDSNRRPAVYETAALPTELVRQHLLHKAALTFKTAMESTISVSVLIRSKY